MGQSTTFNSASLSAIDRASAIDKAQAISHAEKQAKFEADIAANSNNEIQNMQSEEDRLAKSDAPKVTAVSGSLNSIISFLEEPLTNARDAIKFMAEHGIGFNGSNEDKTGIKLKYDNVTLVDTNHDGVITGGEIDAIITKYFGQNTQFTDVDVKTMATFLGGENTKLLDLIPGLFNGKKEVSKDTLINTMLEFFGDGNVWLVGGNADQIKAQAKNGSDDIGNAISTADGLFYDINKISTQISKIKDLLESNDPNKIGDAIAALKDLLVSNAANFIGNAISTADGLFYDIDKISTQISKIKDLLESNDPNKIGTAIAAINDLLSSNAINSIGNTFSIVGRLFNNSKLEEIGKSGAEILRADPEITPKEYDAISKAWANLLNIANNATNSFDKMHYGHNVENAYTILTSAIHDAYGSKLPNNEIVELLKTVESILVAPSHKPDVSLVTPEGNIEMDAVVRGRSTISSIIDDINKKNSSGSGPYHTGYVGNFGWTNLDNLRSLDKDGDGVIIETDVSNAISGIGKMNSNGLMTYDKSDFEKVAKFYISKDWVNNPNNVNAIVDALSNAVYDIFNKEINDRGNGIYTKIGFDVNEIMANGGLTQEKFAQAIMDVFAYKNPDGTKAPFWLVGGETKDLVEQVKHAENLSSTTVEKIKSFADIILEGIGFANTIENIEKSAIELYNFDQLNGKSVSPEEAKAIVNAWSELKTAATRDYSDRGNGRHDKMDHRSEKGEAVKAANDKLNNAIIDAFGLQGVIYDKVRYPDDSVISKVRNLLGNISETFAPIIEGRKV